MFAMNDTEIRAYRAASFFDQARAQRDDVAQGAYPTLSPTPTVIAPRYLNGERTGYFPACIVDRLPWETGAYIVRFDDDEERAAFSHELELA